MAGEGEELVKLEAGAAAGMTRREALLELLRVGGVAAGAAGAAFWLSERSSRPVLEQAQQARRDHRVAADAEWPQMTVVYYPTDKDPSVGPSCPEWRAARSGATGNRKSRRHGPLRRQAGCGGAEAEHRVGSHAGAGREYQSGSCGGGRAAVLAGGSQAGDCDRRELQRAAAVLSALGHPGWRRGPRAQK